MTPHTRSPDITAPIWSLPGHVHATVLDDDVVFLDVVADTYLCLPGAAAVLTIADDLRTLSIRDADTVNDLAQAGLIRPQAGPLPPGRRRASAPTSSAVRDDYPRPGVADLVDGLGACAALARAYRGRPFAHLVGPVRQAPRPDGSALLAVVDRFHGWIPYMPVPGKCLLRSFMLRRLLARGGHPHDWVFGVATWPFRAHCWLQAGEMVLDDTHENVRHFRPIMVV